MIAKFVPMCFSSLNFEQLERIEDRAIHSNNNTVRFDLQKAAKGDRDAQQRVMLVIEKDPSWIGIK